MKRRKRANGKFGITTLQLLTLLVLSCLVCLIFGFAAGYGFYLTTSSVVPVLNQPATQVLMAPSIIAVEFTNTPSKTASPSPTFTEIATETLTPSPTPSLTPTLFFQGNGSEYIPTERDMPSDYKIYTPSSGSVNDQFGSRTYIVYTSDYPNNNHTEEPYLVAYETLIFNKRDLAISTYFRMDKEWVSENWSSWFNASAAISPTTADININDFERIEAYISDFEGISVHGYFVFIKFQTYNAVFTVKTLAHSPSYDREKALASARFFSSLLIQNIVK